MRLSCCQIRTNQTDASQNHMNHYCWLQQRCYRMVQCLFLCNFKKKSKRENKEKCTYKTQLSAEFGPPSLFTICSCRRELAHSCMDNRQLQGCINATLKNYRQSVDFKVSYKPGRERITVFNRRRSSSFNCGSHNR